jgi:putative ABC transport system permease protein
MNNYFLFLIKSALFDFSRNKGRTFLTSLGILIGVLAVVLLTAFGLGLKKYIENQFESLGANLIFVMPGSKKTIMSGGGVIGGIKFDNKDVDKIRRLKTLSYVAPVFAKPGTIIEANAKTEVVELIASNEEMIPVFNLELEKGRMIEKKDVQKTNKIILLSSPLVLKLFPSVDDALGKKVMMENQNFKIIGIIKSKGGGGIGGGGMDNHVYIPFKSSYSFNPDRKYYGIYMKVKSKELVSEAKNEVTQVLKKRYDEDDFSVLEQKEIIDTVSSIFSIINTVLIAIAAISLVVGGIGIMNIMYVTVTERIKEIGIRRALGARKNDILAQFLVESVILSLLGGILGLGISFLIVLGIQSLFPAYINAESIALALGVSSGIGIIFGVFPAKKAADLSPIDAIRYE